MTEPLTNERLLEIVGNVERETGHGPDLDELRKLTGIEHVTSTAAWRRLIGSGRIMYVDGRVVVGRG